jgi:hypothetical protein
MPLQVEDVAAHRVRRNSLTGNEPRAKRIHICLNYALCGSGVRLDAVLRGGVVRSPPEMCVDTLRPFCYSTRFAE